MKVSSKTITEETLEELLKVRDFDVIEDVDFVDCSFSSCSFLECTLKNITYEDVDFNNCDLSLINFENVTMKGVRFEGCKMIGINWNNLNWPTKSIVFCSPINFSNCNISDSSFIGMKLNEIEIIDCSAKNTDFRECSLESALLDGTEFMGALFNQTNLNKASFINAINYTIDMFENNISEATFSSPEVLSLLQHIGIKIDGE